MKKHYKYTLLDRAPPKGYKKIENGEMLLAGDFLYRINSNHIEKIESYSNYINTNCSYNEIYKDWFWVRKT